MRSSLPLSFQATIIQNVIDEGPQTPHDIWYSCHHVSVLLLLLQSYYLSNTHSHTHARSHQQFKMDGLLSQLLWCHLVIALKPHSNRHMTSQCRELFCGDPTHSKIHPYFKIKEFSCSWIWFEIIKEPVYCPFVLSQRTIALLLQYHFTSHCCTSWSLGTISVTTFPEQRFQQAPLRSWLQ